MRQTEDNNDNRGIAMMVRFKSSSGVKQRRKIMVYVKGAQFVERAIPGEEVLWPSAPYWLGRCQYNVTEVMVSVSVWQHVKLSDISLGTRPPYSLVVDKDVKKQPNKYKRHVNSQNLTV